MIQTVKFPIFPSEQERKRLDGVFTIYNRMKRLGYKLLFNGEDYIRERYGEDRTIQQILMEKCGNNPYVNSILIENKTKYAQQETWLEKKRKRMEAQIETIKEKIEKIIEEDKNDRRLRGLYSRLSSVENRMSQLLLKSIVFGGKELFRDRILGKIDKTEFRIRRDSSFQCVGKKQGVNLNIKIREDRTVRIRTFSKEKGKKWIIVPFTANLKQEKWLNEILQLEKYTISIVRRYKRNGIRYYAHVSYEIPKIEINCGFTNGAVGLDFNYDKVSLTNVDRNGELLSYLDITFGNLHTYRRNKRNNHISYKMDKVINYCINRGKGIVVEDLSFQQKFSYNKKLNKKLSNLKTSALQLLERKCLKRGVEIRKVHPAYTSLIGKYKYSRSHNLSTHTLASYVIARRGLGFKEEIPHIYKRLLSQVGGILKPRLKKSSPYYNWSRIHDIFRHCGITSFGTSEVIQKVLSVMYVPNSVTSEQPDNLMAGLSAT